MKKTTMMILTAAAMLTAACSSDDDVQMLTAQSGDGWSEYVTVTAGTAGDSGSGSDGRNHVKVNTSNPQKSLWETGDKLTIWTGTTCSTANMSENGFTLTSGADTGTGTFSGRLKSTSAPTGDTQLIAIIDNGSDAIDASAGNSVSADLSEQQGATAASALDYELYYATSTNAARSFTFTHKMALIKWTIKVNGVSAGDVCDIVLRGTGLKNSVTLDPATGTLTVGSTDGTITLKDVTLTSAASTELFVVLPPCTVSSGIKATLTMTSGDKSGYVGIGHLGDGNAITVAANRYYTAGVNEFDLKGVDLGLPSGTIWAICNVGATNPEDFGDYFAWGETEPYYSSQNPLTWKTGKTGYNWTSYTKFGTYNSSASPDYGFTKYNKTNGPTTLEAADDAATANWGSAWKMPTPTQMQELLDEYPYDFAPSGSKCCCYITDYNSTGVAGFAFYDASNNILLFLPAAGDRSSTSPSIENGYYWSSSLYGSNARQAYLLNLFDDGSDVGTSYRYCGYSVRPVLAQ